MAAGRRLWFAAAAAIVGVGVHGKRLHPAALGFGPPPRPAAAPAATGQRTAALGGQAAPAGGAPDLSAVGGLPKQALPGAVPRKPPQRRFFVPVAVPRRGARAAEPPSQPAGAVEGSAWAAAQGSYFRTLLFALSVFAMLGASQAASSLFSCRVGWASSLLHRRKLSSSAPATLAGSLSKSTRGGLCAAQAAGDIAGAVKERPRLAEKLWDREAWIRGYETLGRENPGELIECPALPKDLVGTYFRNGPAKFKVGTSRVTHPFDGAGCVFAATFYGDGTVAVRWQFVKTPGFVAEAEAGKMLFPGMFGNPRPFYDNGLATTNLANTNVIFHDGRLLALWEGGKPFELDPVSLKTIGEVDVGGSDSKVPIPSVTAHPRYDAATGRLVLYSYSPNPITGTRITIFEVDRKVSGVEAARRRALRIQPRLPLSKEVRPRELQIPRVFGLFHDFVCTANYCVFTVAPTVFGDLAKNGLALLLGTKPAGACIKWSDEIGCATFYVVPRADPSAEPMTLRVDAHFNFHYANAFEDEDGTLVIDTVRASKIELGTDMDGDTTTPVWEKVDFATDVPKSTLWRYRVEVNSKQRALKLVDAAQLCDRYMDFPVLNRDRVSCRPYRYTWAATGASPHLPAPPQGVLKLDVRTGESQVYMPAAHQFGGEPAFAPPTPMPPGAAEDHGYILDMVFDGHTMETSLIVLDAADIEKGPIATVPLGTNLPHGLHGMFVPDFVPAVREVVKRSGKQRTPGCDAARSLLVAAA